MSVNPLNFFSLQSSNEEGLYMYAEKEDLINVLKGRVQSLSNENKRLLKNLEQQRIQMKHLIDEFTQYQANQTEKLEKTLKNRDMLENQLGDIRQKFHESVESIAKLTGYIKQLQIKRIKANEQKQQVKIQYTYLLEKFKLANEQYKQSLQQYQGIQKTNYILTEKNEDMIKANKKLIAELRQTKQLHQASMDKSYKDIREKLAESVDKNVFESINEENRKLRKNIEELKNETKNYKKKNGEQNNYLTSFKKAINDMQQQAKVNRSLKNDILFIYKILNDTIIGELSQPYFQSPVKQEILCIYKQIMQQKNTIEALQLQNYEHEQTIREKDRHLLIKQMLIDDLQQKIKEKNLELVNSIQNLRKQSEYKLLFLSVKIQQEENIVNLLREQMHNKNPQTQPKEIVSSILQQGNQGQNQIIQTQSY